jgi:hypothetical protein
MAKILLLHAVVQVKKPMAGGKVPLSGAMKIKSPHCGFAPETLFESYIR